MGYAYRQRPGQTRRVTHRAAPQRGRRKENIHPSRFIKAAKPVVEEEVYTPENTFEDFLIHPLIKTNLAERGLTVPSPIQDKAIPLGLAGSDIIGIANTGTGKTIAFAVPVLQRLAKEPNARAIILAPTRELAQQIEDECKMLAKSSGLKAALLIGGTNMGGQLKD